MVDSKYIGGYFDWLCEIINLDAKVYDDLIHELYSISFRWILPLDSDRNYDGFVLREEYYGSKEYYSVENKHCSVLEVLIVLARNMNYILDDEDRGDRTRIFFWELIENLGLMKYTNSFLDKPYGRHLDRLNEIHDVIDIWLDRKFGYDGRGSPFILDRPLEDQRDLDMVRQLNAYVLEKHMFEDELL